MGTVQESGLFARRPSALELLERKVADLEARLASVDAKVSQAWHYAGPWRDDRAYDAGCLVQDHGALWVTTNGASAGDRPARRNSAGWASWRIVVRTCRCGQTCRRCGAGV